MKILVSNDDGVSAPGLAALAATLQRFGKITVVAPDRNRSAASNSLTLHRPLRIHQQPNGFYAVNGTPTDSVHLALRGNLIEYPDFIVTGINAGANLGDDVLYSGTVAAALEGRFLGYPAIAVSLVNYSEQCQHYATAATVIAMLLDKIFSAPIDKNLILNINVPDRPLNEIKGIKVTRLGHRHIAEPIIASTDPRGEPVYWIGPCGKEQDAGPGTDFYAINQGYISITPLKTDMTNYQALDPLSTWASQMTISAHSKG